MGESPLVLREMFRNLLPLRHFSEAVSALKQGDAAAFDGVLGSSCALIAAAIAAELPDRPILLVVPAAEMIDKTADDFGLFSDKSVETFPPLQNLRFAVNGPPTAGGGQHAAESGSLWEKEDDEFALPVIFGDDLFGQRLKVLKNRAADRKKSTKRDKKDRPTNSLSRPGVGCPLLITSIAALLQPVPDPETLEKRSQTLLVGAELEQTQLIRWLLEGGYHATPGVDLPGEYAVRGSIVDIFAPDWDRPVRVEFFGDTIESIRTFDIATQRSSESVREIDLSRIRAEERFEAHFADYLPDDAIVLLLEPEEIERAGREYLDRNEQRELLHTTAAVLKRLLKFPYATLSNLTLGAAETVCRLPFESVERLHGDLPHVREILDTIEERICIVCPTEAEIKRLQETFAETRPSRERRLHFAFGNLAAGFQIRGQRTEDRGQELEDREQRTEDRRGEESRLKPEDKEAEPETNEGAVAQRDLHVQKILHKQEESTPCPLSSTLLIGSGQLFERHEIRRTRRRHLGQVIDSFLELKSGDLVVHVSHGIGRFRGLKMLTKGRQEEEHLELEFANDARLYVPSSKIALVQKYIGGTKSKPQLAKLGGTGWSKQKKAVQDAVFDLAVEMLDLQAARSTFPGIPFPEDTDWQLEFDAAFPYRETDDQLDTIEAIKSDMRLPRPMDRLICGDVGFGKTELAMRAAFKAVDAGYQVAVLVPTTVLAEQHYRTFSERMREFPFTIAAISRFQSKKEQARIVEELGLGRIDIVIGTHRLVSKDVRFHNLGLVVIDEEQRFGVDHKERLKKLRQTVDILTLTATPIPRTLHFSLLGLRDISNLETPPEDRRAVETRLVRYHPELIRSAILRELARGGQTFFVHNRVRDIEALAERLQRIVPEARIGIGHAQMHEKELESVMRDFVNHEFDVLLCTTIIESGLDIPNANTIFIDRADRYGLAELHQLRGRVGRYKNQAYCYLLIDANQPLTAIAAKRLRAIEEFSQLGAGFGIAMRDLEIRGAGNILGTQQSGHIAVVGYEMYCQFLEGAVRTLKKLPPKTLIEVEIDLPGRTMIPKTYVPNQRMKIDLYRRITRITNETELAGIREEMNDRFGRPPREVERLLALARLRVAAHRYRVRSIRLEKAIPGDPSVRPDGGYVVLEYVSRKLIEKLRDDRGQRTEDRRGKDSSLSAILYPLTSFRITTDMKAYIPLPESIGGPGGDANRILDFVRTVFNIS